MDLLPVVSMTIQQSVLDLIGNTPMVKANHLDTGLCTLYLKLECMNPGGSIKDRIGVTMIDEAEKAGKIKPGNNTGWLNAPGCIGRFSCQLF